jgi:hypothetical protein
VWRWKVLYRLLGLWARYPRGTAAVLVMGALGAGAYLFAHLSVR